MNAIIIFIIGLTIGHIESVCLNKPTTTLNVKFGNSMVEAVTMPAVTKTILTTTANINDVCLIYIGLRLNATALSELTLISSGAIEKTSCCSLCNADSQCDYAFETASKCSLYHWNIPQGIEPMRRAVEVKVGLWFEKKYFGPNSGKVIFSNRFVQLVLQSALLE